MSNPAHQDIPACMIYAPEEAEFQPCNRLFQGIPSLERTPNGRLFACFYGGELEEKAGNYAVLAISDDDGETWTEPYAVVKHPDPSIRIFDPCLWMDPDGRLWFTWSQTPEYYDGRHGVWAAVCADPDAEKPVFGQHVRISNGVMMCKPIVLSDGAWMFPCALWGAWLGNAKLHPELDGERLSNAVVSTDHGETFVRRGGADVKNRCFDEHMIVEKQDGTLWMLVRRYDGIGESFSRDGGYTWEGRGHAGITGPCSRFFIRRLHSGNLLLVNHVDFHGRNNIAAKLSCDDGKTWSEGLLLDGRSSIAYPDGVEGSDGIIRIVYDRERLNAREILMAEFREEDILKGTMEPSDAQYVTRKIVSKAGVKGE